MVQIAIDRDATHARRARDKDEAIVATFVDPVVLYRVLDGEELARVVQSGQILGGMFSTSSERAYGASWATVPVEDVIHWGQNWQANKRLGRDLFIARAQGQGRRFYHMSPDDVPFNPVGPARQQVQMADDQCNTGLGCSVRIAMADVEFSRVLPASELRPMTHAEIEAYAAKKLNPVMLLPLGGTNVFAGTINGYRVIVSQDQEDKLWLVRLVIGEEMEHEERRLVMGGRSKKQVVDEALQLLAEAPLPTHTIFLNVRPLGFERVAKGQVWLDRQRARPDRIEIVRVGASYVRGKWLDRPDWGVEETVIDAKRFLKNYALT